MGSGVHRWSFRDEFLGATGVKGEAQRDAVRVLVLDHANRMVGHTALDHLSSRMDRAWISGRGRPQQQHQDSQHFQSHHRHAGDSSSSYGGEGAGRPSGWRVGGMTMSESYAEELARTGETEASYPVIRQPIPQGVQFGGGRLHDHTITLLNERVPELAAAPPPPPPLPPADGHWRVSQDGGHGFPSEPSSQAPMNPELDPLAEKLEQLERLWQGMQRLQRAFDQQQRASQRHGSQQASPRGCSPGGGLSQAGDRREGSEVERQEEEGRGQEREEREEERGVMGHGGSEGHDSVQESRRASVSRMRSGGSEGGGGAASSSSSSSSSGARRVEGDGASRLNMSRMTERLGALEESIGAMQRAHESKRAQQQQAAVARAQMRIGRAAARWAFGTWRGVANEAIRIEAGKASAEVGYYSPSHRLFTSADLERKMASPKSDPRSSLHNRAFGQGPPRPPTAPNTPGTPPTGHGHPRSVTTQQGAAAGEATGGRDRDRGTGACASPGRAGGVRGASHAGQGSLQDVGDTRYTNEIEKDNASLRSLLAELSVAYEDAVQRLHHQGLFHLQSPSSSQLSSRRPAPPPPDVVEIPPYIRREGSRAAPVIHHAPSHSSHPSHPSPSPAPPVPLGTSVSPVLGPPSSSAAVGATATASTGRGGGYPQVLYGGPATGRPVSDLSAASSPPGAFSPPEPAPPALLAPSASPPPRQDLFASWEKSGAPITSPRPASPTKSPLVAKIAAHFEAQMGGARDRRGETIFA